MTKERIIEILTSGHINKSFGFIFSELQLQQAAERIVAEIEATAEINSKAQVVHETEKLKTLLGNFQSGETEYIKRQSKELSSDMEAMSAAVTILRGRMDDLSKKFIGDKK